MSRVRRFGAVLAVACAGLPALLGASLANASPAAAARLLRCESCSKTSCSSNGLDDRLRATKIKDRSARISAAKADDTGVPGSDTAVIYSNFPTQDKPRIATWKRILEGENYKVTEDLGSNSGAGTATLANFVEAARAGVLIISTHGADVQQSGFNGLLVSEFTTQAALDAAWNADEKVPAYKGGALRKVNFVDNHRNASVFSLWITEKGIQRLIGNSKDRPDDQLVFNGACWSDHLAAAFGSTAYFGYTQPASDAEVYGDLALLLGRLDGTRDRGLQRDTTSAWTAGGFTRTQTNQLEYHAQPDSKSVVLSPDASEVKYPDDQKVALPGTVGPFKVEFDAAMDTSVSPRSVLSVKGATLSTASWSSPSELTFSLKRPTCADLCPVTLTIAAKKAVSAGKFHNWLDGNLDPADGRAGEYPNGDDEQLPFAFASWHQQTAPDPNLGCSGLPAVAAASPDDVWAVGTQGLGKCVPWGTLTEHWNGKEWTTVSSDSPAGSNDYLEGVGVAGPKDYWAVGFTQSPDDTGTPLVEHSTGSSWTTESASSVLGWFSSQLSSVSAPSAKDIWAVGWGSPTQTAAFAPIVMHSDGAGFTGSSPKSGNDGGSTELLAVDAVSATSIWAAGWTANADNTELRAIMLHSTGGGFTEVDLGGTTSGSSYSQLGSISAVSPADVWSVGYTSGLVSHVDVIDPLIEHFDGKTWDEVPSHLATGIELEAVTADSADSVWAAGYSYTGAGGQVLIHWDGKKWSRVVAPTAPFAHVWGMASSKSGYAVAVGSLNSESPFVEAFTPSTTK